MLLSCRWNSIAVLALASAVGPGLAAVADDEPTQPEQKIEIRAIVVEEEGSKDFVVDPRFVFVADGAEEASPFWIGVQLESPPEILKDHLRLEGGMVAVHIFEGSPAEKGGLKANDIILKAGDIYVKEPGDLLKSVGEAKDKELTLVLLRGGKETTLKVVPAKRPEEQRVTLTLKAAEHEKEATHKLESALKEYRLRRADLGEAPAVDVIRVRPGVVADPHALQLGLPKNVAVTITKEGTSPAKIVVKKDGKSYEVTEDKIDELPEEVRGYLKTLQVGSGPALTLKAKVAPPNGPPVTTKTAPHTQILTLPKAPAGAETAKIYRYHVETKHAGDEVDSKLEQILKIVSQKEDSSVSALRKEVEQLRKELEALRKEKK